MDCSWLRVRFEVTRSRNNSAKEERGDLVLWANTGLNRRSVPSVQSVNLYFLERGLRRDF